jgi:hypothetical protein
MRCTPLADEEAGATSAPASWTGIERTDIKIKAQHNLAFTFAINQIYSEPRFITKLAEFSLNV